MAKFYIVAKEKDDYSLIAVNKGNCLEDIDLLTSNFKDKEEFLKYLIKKGYKFSEDVDLFAVNKGRKEFYYRELVYGNLDLAKLAKKSKEGKLEVTDTCNTLLQKAQIDFNFQDLIRRNAFELYGDLRTMILNSLRNKKIKISSNKNWMRKNYYVGRDALASLDMYKNSYTGDSEEFIREQKRKKEDRKTLDKFLYQKIDHDNEQISLVGEPSAYINLTYINAEKLVEPNSKKVKRMQKMGIPNNKIIDELTIPYEMITEEIDYRFSRTIANCLMNLPYRKIKWGQRERYEIDFKRWAEEFDIELNDSDMKFLNGLLDTKLRHDGYWHNYYENQLYSTAATRREAQSYKNSIINKLSNSATKRGETYNKAYNFYLIYQELTKSKENDRGGYGRK